MAQIIYNLMTIKMSHGVVTIRDQREIHDFSSFFGAKSDKLSFLWLVGVRRGLLENLYET